MKFLTEKIDTFVREVEVIVSPGVLSADVAPRFEAAHQLNYVQIRNVDGGMASIHIIFACENTVVEQRFADRFNIRFGHQHLL